MEEARARPENSGKSECSAVQRHAARARAEGGAGGMGSRFTGKVERVSASASVLGCAWALRGLPLCTFHVRVSAGWGHHSSRSLARAPSLCLLCIFRVPPLVVIRENATEGIVSGEKARAGWRTRAECLRTASPEKFT